MGSVSSNAVFPLQTEAFEVKRSRYCSTSRLTNHFLLNPCLSDTRLCFGTTSTQLVIRSNETGQSLRVPGCHSATLRCGRSTSDCFSVGHVSPTSSISSRLRNESAFLTGDEKRRDVYLSNEDIGCGMRSLVSNQCPSIN